MANKHRIERGRGRKRNISVRGVRRDSPDLHKLIRAVIQYAIKAAAAEAAAEAEAAKKREDQPDA